MDVSNTLEISEDLGNVYSIYKNSCEANNKGLTDDDIINELKLPSQRDFKNKNSRMTSTKKRKARAKSNYQNFMEKIEKVELNDLNNLSGI